MFRPDMVIFGQRRAGRFRHIGHGQSHWRDPKIGPTAGSDMGNDFAPYPTGLMASIQGQQAPGAPNRCLDHRPVDRPKAAKVDQVTGHALLGQMVRQIVRDKCQSYAGQEGKARALVIELSTPNR